MQDVASLKNSHFGRRLQERFGVEFTLGVRKEFFSLIEKKKLRVAAKEPGVGLDGKPNTRFILKGYWRDHKVVLVISNSGDFITISDSRNSISAYCRKVRYEKLRGASHGENTDTGIGSEPVSSSHDGTGRSIHDSEESSA